MKTNFFLPIVVFTALYGCCRYFYYGSLLSTCPYSEVRLQLPSVLANSTITVFRKSHEIVGGEPELACLPVNGKVLREIVHSKLINSTSSRAQGQIFKELLPGEKEFKAIEFWQVSKKGLVNTLAGATYRALILVDNDGVRHSLIIETLGINQDDQFLKIVKSNSEHILTPATF